MKPKSIAQVQKDTLQVVDRQLLFDRLNTLDTLYGLEGVVVLFNDWLLTVPSPKVYRCDLIMDEDREYQDHVDNHPPGSNPNCPWCEHEYQGKLDEEKEYAKAK